jgi:hypothetical protein
MTWFAEVREWKREPHGMDFTITARYGPFDDEVAAAAYARDRCADYAALQGYVTEDGEPRFTAYWYEDPVFKPLGAGTGHLSPHERVDRLLRELKEAVEATGTKVLLLEVTPRPGDEGTVRLSEDSLARLREFLGARYEVLPRAPEDEDG